MARRRRRFEELEAGYRARLERHGITASYYESGGNLQLARGHKYKREHIVRRERNPTGFDSADYRFLKNQQRRSASDDFDAEIEAYRRLNKEQRANLRSIVAGLHREYKKHKSVSGIVLGKGTDSVQHAIRDFPDMTSVPNSLLFYH